MHLDAVRPLILVIEHGYAGRSSAGACEEQLLGGEVGVHVAVKIQVVARQVGEDGSVEVETVDAAEGEGVRGHLHGDVRPAGAFQLGEQAQKVERFRGGVDGFQDAARQVVFDCPDHGGGFSAGAEYRIDEVRRSEEHTSELQSLRHL